MEKKKIFVGIDSGTTNSGIAVMEEFMTRPNMLRNREDSELTASVVAVHSKEEVNVGDIARNGMTIYAERTMSEFKRLLGKEKVVKTIDGTPYSPEQCTAFVLKSLVNDYEEEYGTKIEDVVITCPAYHGDAERKALKDAAKLAGINVVELLDEPEAIVLAIDNISNLDGKRVLVFDVGGGTTDCVVISASKNTLQEEIISGDANLGGCLYDKAFAKYIRETYLSGEVLDVESEQELILKTEKAKIKLSTKESTTFSVSTSDGRKEITVTRSEFEACTAFLAEKINEVIADVKTKMELKNLGGIDKVILAGGSTRMPQIQAAIEEAFPGVEIVSKDADHAVALGAAIYAKMLHEKNDCKFTRKTNEQGQEPLMEIKELKRVSSRSYGIAAYTDNVLKISNMIFQNDNLPTKKTKTFFTRFDNANCVLLSVYESTSMNLQEELTNGHILGELNLEIKGQLPKGSPIDVELYLNEDGTISVKGYEPIGNTKIEATMKTEALLSDKEFKKQKEEIDPMLLLIE